MICKIVLPPNEIYKLPKVPTCYNELYEVTTRKFKGKIPENFQFKYKDSESDLITLSNDEDLLMAIKTNEMENVKVLRILVFTEANEEHEQPHMLMLEQLSKTYDNEIHGNTIATPSFYSADILNQPNSRKAVGRGTVNSNETVSLDSYKNQSFTSQMLINSMPPLDRNTQSSQKTSFGSKRSMTFNFERLSSFHSVAGRDGSLLPDHIFTYRQMEALNQMIDEKFNEMGDQKTVDYFHEYINKQSSSSNNSQGYKIKVTHDSTISSIANMMSKTSLPSSNTRSPAKKNKVKFSDEEFLCSLCDRKIQNVRYSCLECVNFYCCETCEENIRHKHPLLKDRLGNKFNNIDSDHETLDLSYNGSLRDTTERIIPSYNRMGSLTTNKSQSGSDDTNVKEFKSIISTTSRFGKDAKTLKHSNTVHEIGIADSGTSETRLGPPRRNSRKSSTIIESNTSTIGSLSNKSTIGSQDINDDDVRNFLYNDDNLATSQSISHITPSGNESKKYKVQITKASMYDLINAKCGEFYDVELTIKNTGDDWPGFVKLICINGVHKGHIDAIPPLHPGQKYQVRLRLKAPAECGWHLSHWRLSYNEDETTKMFGSNIFVEVNVVTSGGNNKESGSSGTDQKNLNNNMGKISV